MFGFGKKKAKKDETAESGDDSEADDLKMDSASAEDDGEEGEDGEAPAKKKLPVKLLAMAAAAVLVIGGGGGAAAWFFLLKGDAGEHAEGGDGHGKAAAKGGGHGEAESSEPIEIAGGGFIRPGPEGVVFYTLPDVLTNIQTTDGRPNALKLKITFEVHDQSEAELIGSQMPRLQDVLQNFLRELRPEDLNGSQGMYRLRQEIQRRVNLVIAPSKVDAVLIEEMLQT